MGDEGAMGAMGWLGPVPSDTNTLVCMCQVVEAPPPVIAGLRAASQAVVDAAMAAGVVASPVVGFRSLTRHPVASGKGAEWLERQPGIVTRASARVVRSRGRC
jgi:hypothetical protein